MPVRYVSRDPPRAPPPDPTGYAPPPYPGPYPPAYPMPYPPPTPPGPQRSHVAALVALAFVVLGIYLASWTVLVPVALALLLFSSGLSFLGARLNPLSLGYYLTVKPSWTAIGAVMLGGLLLLAVAYSYWKHGWGPVVPHRLMPW